jgi:hypothetical protein
MPLTFTILPDNRAGASATARLRAYAAALAMRIPLNDGPDEADAEVLAWVNGSCSDQALVSAHSGLSPEEEAESRRFQQRREFAVMYARSCALSGEDEPLAAHQHEFDLFASGVQSFEELRFSVGGWSLEEDALPV